MKKALLLIFLSIKCFSQNVDLKLNKDFSISEISGNKPGKEIPFLKFELDKNEVSILDESWKSKIEIKIEKLVSFRGAVHFKIIFNNISKDTLNIRNVVPFDKSQTYITGKGDHWLSRAHLFLPNKKPINVILPDNAWEMGYADLTLNNQKYFGLVRRKSWENATRKRFEIILSPNGSVLYEMYMDSFEGEWQEGLRKAFQVNYIYDLGNFDETMYKRPDLKWMQDVYVMHFVMAWDNWIYRPAVGYSPFYDFLEKGKRFYGGDDVVGIWPTWPALGMDERNQWDLFKDLPGGLSKLNQLAKDSRKNGSKFFICYNPWDESTKYKGSAKEGAEGHLNGLGELVKAIGADGVVLDTKGESSRDLQAAVDAVKPGVVMYSEGMAVPKNMPGIISGRVHNALYYPPMLNLNKLIRPDFQILRVAELFQEPIKREFFTSLFNGYGVEMNIFRNGKPQDWIEEQYKVLGKVAMILRENSALFHSKTYIPLIPTISDSIYVNHWKISPAKISPEIYTVYSIKPEGFRAPLFETVADSGYHFVSIWHHNLLEKKKLGEKYFIEAETHAYDKKWIGTNNESEVDVIAKFLNLLELKHNENSNDLIIKAKAGTEIKIWYGNPSYEKDPISLKREGTSLNKTFKLNSTFEGKVMVQLFENKQIIDEQILDLKAGVPRLLSETIITKSKSKNGMVKVPTGNFVFKTTHGDDFVYYPECENGKEFSISSFFMDKNLVTNSQFQQFLKISRYKPSDSHNFLKQYKESTKKDTLAQYPVVNVSYEDAQSFCKYYGKRIPTEKEWQYAAQFPDIRAYPWGNEFDSTKTNNVSGNLMKIEQFPPNALGINDLVGNVWQLTNDIYANGSYQYIILKGGSYFKPTASWWYVTGGPQKLTHRQHLLRVSQGFERNNTVGFRCVSDE